MVTANGELEATTANGRTPPYFSPVTFWNFVETHRRTPPTRIDRSLMTHVAGGDQAKIVSAFQFFGLSQPNGRPTPEFEAMRDLEGDALKSAWAALLRKSYPFLFDGFNLAQATQSEIEERFRQQGIQGETVRKGVAFFISLARQADVALSPYFKATRQRTTRNGARRSPRRRDEGNGTGGAHDMPGTLARTVRFRSGGTASLYIDVDLATISRDDRETLFQWIDEMSDYDEESVEEDAANA